MLPSVRVSAPATDTAPPPPDGVRFFEVAIDDRTQAYFIAIAPRGGAIEPHTDDEARRLRLELVSNAYPATMWTVTRSRERLTAGTSHPPIYIQRASHCYKPLPLGRSAMVSLSTAFRNGPVMPIFTSAEEPRTTSRGKSGTPSKTHIYLWILGLPRKTTIRNSRGQVPKTLLSG
jgi:hypothetical protein